MLGLRLSVAAHTRGSHRVRPQQNAMCVAVVSALWRACAHIPHTNAMYDYTGISPCRFDDAQVRNARVPHIVKPIRMEPISIAPESSASMHASACLCGCACENVLLHTPRAVRSCTEQGRGEVVEEKEDNRGAE